MAASHAYRYGIHKRDLWRGKWLLDRDVTGTNGRDGFEERDLLREIMSELNMMMGWRQWMF